MTNNASPSNQQHQTHILRNTLLVAAFFGLATAGGLLRNVIIARQFGIGAELDAYFAAFKLPDLLFTIVAGGALATAFIPVFAEFLSDDDRQGAWRLASAITNLVVIVVSVLAVIAALIAPWLVATVIAPGFDAAQQAETASLMRLVLISTVLFGISAVQSSVLHGFRHFLLPALAPVVYPLGITAGAIWLVPTWGIRGLAMGAIIGAAMHLLVKVPGLIYYGFRWSPVLDLDSQAVRRVLILMGPRVLDLGVFHLMLVATTNLASRLDEGSVSALEWGWDAMQIPETIIGTAFGLVAFPTMAALASSANVTGFRSTLSQTLRMIIVLTVPATFGLILLGRPLLSIVYERGAFDASATDAVFIALQFYALGLTGHACLEVAARAFFARQDTVTPLIIAVIFGVINILLALLLMRGMGHGGLALANSLAITAEVIALLVVLRRRIDGVDEAAILATFGRSLVASVVMAGVIYGIIALGSSALPTLVLVSVAGLVGVVVYIAAGLLLGMRTLSELPGVFLGREKAV